MALDLHRQHRPSITLERARSLIAAGLGSDAVELLSDTLETDPNQRNAWHLLFESLAPTGSLAPLLTLIERTIDRIVEPENMLLMMARHMQLNGYFEDAVRSFDLILAAAPQARQTFEEKMLDRHLNGFDDDDAFAAYHEFNTRFAKPVAAASRAAEAAKDPARPLKLGFVSRDFASGHSLKWAMAAWFDRPKNRDDIYVLYSSSAPDQTVEPFFEEAADEFVDVYDLSDEALAERIRADEIDILVDFMGHMPGNRLMAYARKPAPIILSWMGLGTAAGIEAVDYFIADPVYILPETIDRYVEKVIHFDGAGIIWRPPANCPEIAPAPALQTGTISFCNLNRTVKLQEQSLQLFAKVLLAVPKATITFKDMRMDARAEQRLAAPLLAAGVSADRIRFLGRTSQYDHMTTYNQTDIALDGFPQQGGISSLEALWMGNPVISYSEALRPSTRAGAWILEMIGLPALATKSEAAYIATAVRLEANRQSLAELRPSLRDAVLTSPICDRARFTANVGKMLTEIWRRYCADEAPRSFAIADLKQ